MQPSATGDPNWWTDSRTFTPQNIGRAFWERGWTADGWEATPFISYALLPTAR